MTPEQRERVKEVLAAALDREPETRTSYVDETCGGDPAVGREVLSLLAQETVPSPLLDRPLLAPVTAPEDESAGQLTAGQRIGPYQIVRELGHGGMGAVYLAAREDDFRKQVALKVVRSVDLSAEARRRFDNERQILAELEHPHVARILDGGTIADGRPYFVMEYVEGEPIDQFCDRRRLTIRERLELFRQVCSAVHVAHQNLVVHRDLKPSNVLVTADGTPKLLDFGIAKQLAPQAGTELTQQDRRPMTLRYASPEQIAGRPLTTASDVYSLGVVLYELVCGHGPYAAAGDTDPELVRAICEEEPRRPSTAIRFAAERRSAAGVRRRLSPEALSRARRENPRRLRRQLSGDLDGIVLMAMRKEPARRYGSAEQLSEDLRRYLGGRSVMARKSTWRYRTGKFVRRNKLALVAATALVLVGIAFAVTTTVLWRRAVDQRERSDQVVVFLKGLFRTSDPDQARGEELTAGRILERGTREVDQLTDPLVRAEILGTVAEIYVKLGRSDAARAPRERALALLRQHYGDDHPQVAKAINNLAGVVYRLGDYDEAERLYREALAMKRSLRRQGVDIPKTMSNLATILMSRGELSEAEDLYRQALARREKIHGVEDPDVGTTLRSLGNLLYVRGDFEQAEPPLRRALAIRMQAYGSKHTKVAAVRSSLGRVLLARGRYEEAEELLTLALDVRRTRLGDRHPHVAVSKRDLAELLLAVGEPATAQILLVQALATLCRSPSEESWECAATESLLGALLTARGRYAEAEPCLAESHRTLARIRGEQAVYTRNAERRLRDLYRAWGKPHEANEDGDGAQ